MGDYAQLVGESTDVVVGMEGDIPLAIIPVSPRALSTFHQWGMDEGILGIVPPEDAMDLVKILPQHWIFEALPLLLGLPHTVQEITLPQHRVVVH